MSKTKISYAAITSKNVATTELNANNSTAPAPQQPPSLAPSQAQQQAHSNQKSFKSANNNNNNNNSINSFNSKTGDFPVLSENNKPAADLFPPNELNNTSNKTSLDSVAVNEIQAQSSTVPYDDSNGFTEKTRRRSDRNQANKTNNNDNKQSNRRKFQGNNKSNAPSSAPSRRNNNTNNNSRPTTGAGGDKKTFAELLDEETQKLKLKYQKEPKPSKLCFDFVRGDLFLVESDVSLAHCVSEDFRMSKGIATEFRKRYNSVDELLAQNVKTGGCAYIKHEDRYVFYMVTKKYYNHKPYYNCVENSLKSLVKLCKELNVTKLAMPMIATGLDKLEWDLVSRIIDDVFSKTNINLTIHKYENPNSNNNNSSNNNNNKNNGNKKRNRKRSTKSNSSSNNNASNINNNNNNNAD